MGRKGRGEECAGRGELSTGGRGVWSGGES